RSAPATAMEEEPGKRRSGIADSFALRARRARPTLSSHTSARASKQVSAERVARPRGRAYAGLTLGISLMNARTALSILFAVSAPLLFTACSSGGDQTSGSSGTTMMTGSSGSTTGAGGADGGPTDAAGGGSATLICAHTDTSLFTLDATSSDLALTP